MQFRVIWKINKKLSAVKFLRDSTGHTATLDKLLQTKLNRFNDAGLAITKRHLNYEWIMAGTVFRVFSDH